MDLSGIDNMDDEELNAPMQVSSTVQVMQLIAAGHEHAVLAGAAEHDGEQIGAL